VIDVSRSETDDLDGLLLDPVVNLQGIACTISHNASIIHAKEGKNDSRKIRARDFTQTHGNPFLRSLASTPGEDQEISLPSFDLCSFPVIIPSKESDSKVMLSPSINTDQAPAFFESQWPLDATEEVFYLYCFMNGAECVYVQLEQVQFIKNWWVCAYNNKLVADLMRHELQAGFPHTLFVGQASFEGIRELVKEVPGVKGIRLFDANLVKIMELEIK
jgi:hypothetical protein